MNATNPFQIIIISIDTRKPTKKRLKFPAFSVKKTLHFSRKENLDAHQKKCQKKYYEKSKSKFTFSDCNNVFSTIGSLKRHENSHNPKPVPKNLIIKCHICKKNTYSYNLKRHVESQHKIKSNGNFVLVSNKKSSNCIFCKSVFASANNFKRHVNSTHNVKKLSDSKLAFGDKNENFCVFENENEVASPSAQSPQEAMNENVDPSSPQSEYSPQDSQKSESSSVHIHKYTVTHYCSI